MKTLAQPQAERVALLHIARKFMEDSHLFLIDRCTLLNICMHRLIFNQEIVSWFFFFKKACDRMPEKLKQA